MLWSFVMDNNKVVYASEFMKYHKFEQKGKKKNWNSTLWFKESHIYFYFVAHRSYANILIVSFLKESRQKCC